MENGALGGTRTHGLSLRRAALYPLSYKRALPPHAHIATTLTSYSLTPGDSNRAWGGVKAIA